MDNIHGALRDRKKFLLFYMPCTYGPGRLTRCYETTFLHWTLKREGITAATLQPAHGRDNVKDVYRLYAVSLWMY